MAAVIGDMAFYVAAYSQGTIALETFLFNLAGIAIAILVNIVIPRVAVWDAVLIPVILGVKLAIPVSWIVVLVAAVATLLLILY